MSAAELAPPADPAADKAALRAFRPRRTVPAVITAILLTLVGFVVAAQVISALVGRPLNWVPYEGLLRWASATAWQSPPVMAGAALVTVIGLALLLAAFLPGRPRLVPVRTGDPELIIGMRRRSFAEAMAGAAREVPGVRSAHAAVRGRTITVTATTSGWDDANASEAVRNAALTKLAALATVEPYRVSVRLRER